MYRRFTLLSLVALFFATVTTGKSLYSTDDGNRCTDPSYACRGFAEAHSCGAVKPCIKHVWEKLVVPKDTNEICDLCKEMVKEARDQLLSNETQEELREVFEGSCNLIPIKPIASACIQLVDELIPQLVEMLASEMDPNTVCTVAGLCNGDTLAKLIKGEGIQQLLESELTNLKESSRKCSTCKMTSGIVKRIVASTSMKDIEHLLLDFCKKDFPGTKCELKVAEYWPAIYLFLENMNVEVVCHAMHLCDESSTSSLTVFRPPVKDGDDLTCEFCESLVQHVKDMVTSNSTVEQFRTALLNFCKMLGNFKDECTQLVQDYYDKFFQFIEEELDPQTVCSLMGLCQSDARFAKPSASSSIPATKIAESAKKLQYALPMMRLLPAKALAKPIQKPKVEVFPPDTNFKKNKYELFEKSETNSVHAVPLSKKPAKDDLECEVCKDVVDMLKKEIERNETEDAMREALKKGCSELPKSMVQQCDELVDQYLDMLVRLLAEELDARAICESLGLCNDVGRLTKKLVLVKANDIDCDLCKQVAAFLEKELKDNHTEEAIRTALEKVCSYLPESIQGDCQTFVDQYTETLIAILEEELDPQTVCSMLGLCKDGTVKVTGRPIIQVEANDVNCELCKQVAAFLEKELKDNQTEEAIRAALEKVCKYLPDSIKGDCQNFVDQYTETLIAILEEELDPQTVCAMIGLCEGGGTKVLECTICQDVLHFIQAQMMDTHNQEELKKLLKEGCNKLPAALKDNCIAFIEEYGDSLIVILAQEMDPSVVCIATKMCPASHKKLANTVPIKKLDLDECGTCETIVDYVDKLLEDDDVDRDITKVVEKVCNAIPTSLKKQCITLLESYGPYILQMIGQVADSKEICRAFDLCPPPPGHVHLLGKEKCSYGPSYWCKSRAHAAACKAESFCHQVWASKQ